MDRSLRIALMLNPFTLKVKGGDHAPALAQELLGRGHTVRGFGAPAGWIPRSGPEPSVEGGVLGEEGGGVLGFRPDVIVAYDGLSPAAALGARAAKRAGVPLILVDSGFEGGGRWHERVARRAGQAMWGRLVRSQARHVVALDPVAREQCLGEGFDPRRVDLLAGGVDLASFRPGLTSRLVSMHRIRGRILLHVGRIEYNRGLETLVAAFAATVGQRNDWSLVFAGEGSARNSLGAMASRLGVSDRVHWLGRPRGEELPGLMGASTVLATPALDNSVRGKQIPRALACSLPVLASDLPRLRFQVEHDGCGLIVPPGDVAAWTDSVRRACGDPAARDRWRRRAREVAEERFSWPTIAETFEGWFFRAREELAGRRRRPLPEGEQLPSEQ